MSVGIVTEITTRICVCYWHQHTYMCVLLTSQHVCVCVTDITTRICVCYWHHNTYVFVLLTSQHVYVCVTDITTRMRRAHILFMLFAFVAYSSVRHISCCALFFFVLLPVTLDCPFLIAPSIFSNVYLQIYMTAQLHSLLHALQIKWWDFPNVISEWNDSFYSHVIKTYLSASFYSHVVNTFPNGSFYSHVVNTYLNASFYSHMINTYLSAPIRYSLTYIYRYTWPLNYIAYYMHFK
jgi:hypothetical protein